MPIIVKIGSVVNKQQTKRDAILSLLETFADKGPNGRDLSDMISVIARTYKVPVNLLVNQAIGILAAETGYLTSGQYKACNNGGMTTNAKNWLGSKVVRNDTLLVQTGYIPVKQQVYFDISTYGSTNIEIVEDWFKKDSQGNFTKYTQPGGSTTYPILKEQWMGVIIKCLYLVTDKTPAAYITAKAKTYAATLYKPYANTDDGPSQKKAITRLATNTLIYNSPGTQAGLDSYVTLVESVKRNLLCTIL